MKKTYRHDPLHEIIERHLFENLHEKLVPKETPVQLNKLIIDEYLLHLNQKGIFIPQKFREVFIEDLKTEISEVAKKTK
jgi:hypothetical protein